MESDEKSVDLVSNLVQQYEPQILTQNKNFKQYLNSKHKHIDENDNKFESDTSELASFNEICNEFYKLNFNIKETLSQGNVSTSSGIILIDNTFDSVKIDNICRQIDDRINQHFKYCRMKSQPRARKYNNIDWRFLDMYDYKNPGNYKPTPLHGITNDGKTVVCNYHGTCRCFYRCSFEMAPNSGIYTIKLKIDDIDSSYNSIIGITCNTDETNNSQYKDYWYCSTDFMVILGMVTKKIIFLSKINFFMSVIMIIIQNDYHQLKLMIQ